ncbi:unnamed protein product [Diabrotica balteata]|uniref:Proton channel OtopLc-like n=1 Tax=Diabrotica balteata TaxID=107213 RepID=A0A9N9XIP4_DIABA|nr:unnamed protein product [Diabrotica balteata]
MCILRLFNDSSETSKKEELDSKELGKIKRNRRIGEDALSIILSALYAKLVVVLGIAFPVIEVISTERPYFYQSFYIYLYLGSIVFVTYMYATLVKEKALVEMINSYKHRNTGNISLNKKFCQEGLVMSSLVANASPFLFPCTIEYSLICAVILFEMWKRVKMTEKGKDGEKDKNVRFDTGNQKVATHFQFNQYGGKVVNSNHHFTIDCSNAHKGLFAGILVIVLTIISLIMFFVFTNTPRHSENVAIFEVNIVELILYIVTSIAALIAAVKMRNLKYDRKIGHEGNSTGIGLDCILLVVAQTGMFIYCVFSVIGCCFTVGNNNELELATEIFSFIQTCIQTIFVLDAWWRRCKNIEQVRLKPGKELITFLIIANMAMWAINTLEKNRAEFMPNHLQFFGDWAWTIITHVSMPLAIFYRFHSTICLFEIWKTAYKIKTKYDTAFPLV